MERASVTNLEEFTHLFSIEFQPGQRQLEGSSRLASLLHVTQRQGSAVGEGRGAGGTSKDKKIFHGGKRNVKEGLLFQDVRPRWVGAPAHVM